MKKYKLIKKYPGSTEVGEIVQGSGKEGWYTRGPGCRTYDWTQIVYYPEFWEEVIENSFEILSFKQDSGITDLWTLFREGWSRNVNGYPVTGPYTTEAIVNNKLYNIHSVKRLSDGEIFTIGDRAKTITSQGRHTVTQLSIRQKCTGRDGKGGYNYDGIDRIWIDWEDDCGGNWLESTEKIKQPIFLTHDGKDIFAEDRVWYVNKDNFYYDYIIAQPEVKFNSEIRAYFLTREAAEDYIKRNKVLFTTEDGVEIKKDQIVYVVDGRLTSIDMISNFKPENYPTMKAFSTSKAAEDYLIENKYALSIKDFWEFVCWGGSNFAKSKRLKRLVKERLNLQ